MSIVQKWFTTLKSNWKHPDHFLKHLHTIPTYFNHFQQCHLSLESPTHAAHAPPRAPWNLSASLHHLVNEETSVHNTFWWTGAPQSIWSYRINVEKCWYPMKIWFWHIPPNEDDVKSWSQFLSYQRSCRVNSCPIPRLWAPILQPRINCGQDVILPPRCKWKVSETTVLSLKLTVAPKNGGFQ